MIFNVLRRASGRLPGLAAALLLAGPAAAAPQADDVVAVALDQAQIVKIPDQAATVVIGNPLIADVTVQAGGILILTGKGYGVTNLIALDRAGKVLLERFVEVQGPVDSVVVYRGVNRESYSCTPLCERRITLGDTPEFFDLTIKQTGERNTNAQGGGAAPRGR